MAPPQYPIAAGQLRFKAQLEVYAGFTEPSPAKTGGWAHGPPGVTDTSPCALPQPAIARTR